MRPKKSTTLIKKTPQSITKTKHIIQFKRNSSLIKKQNLDTLTNTNIFQPTITYNKLINTSIKNPSIIKKTQNTAIQRPFSRKIKFNSQTKKSNLITPQYQKKIHNQQFEKTQTQFLNGINPQQTSKLLQIPQTKGPNLILNTRKSKIQTDLKNKTHYTSNSIKAKNINIHKIATNSTIKGSKQQQNQQSQLSEIKRQKQREKQRQIQLQKQKQMERQRQRQRIKQQRLQRQIQIKRQKQRDKILQKQKERQKQRERQKYKIQSMKRQKQRQKQRQRQIQIYQQTRNIEIKRQQPQRVSVRHVLQSDTQTQMDSLNEIRISQEIRQSQLQRQRQQQRIRERENQRQNQRQRQRLRNLEQSSLNNENNRVPPSNPEREQRNMDLSNLIANTQDIISFINRLSLNNRVQTFDLMLSQLTQLNLIAQQVQQLGQMGNNLGYTMINVFGTRIRQLQTTIINQVGLALITSFQQRMQPQFEALVLRQPALRTGFSKKDIEEMFEQQMTLQEAQCSICLQNVKSGQLLIQLQCRHQYHPICIKTWLQNSKKCPMCRKQQIRGH